MSSTGRSACARTVGRQLGEEVPRAVVLHRVRRVEPQAVDVVLVHPVQRVLDEEAAHRGAVRAVEVHALAPRAAVPVGEVVRAEGVGVGAVRPEVVVDHVEDRRRGRARARRRRARAGRRACRSSAPARTARRRRSPSCASPGKSATGISSMAVTPRSARYGRRSIAAAERPLRRERADVQLVDHESRRAAAAASPASVQRNARGIDDLRRPVHAVRLEARRRVREDRSGVVAVEAITVAGAGRDVVERPRPVAASPRVSGRAESRLRHEALGCDSTSIALASGRPHANVVPRERGSRAQRRAWSSAMQRQNAAAAGRRAGCAPSRAGCSARSPARTAPCRATKACSSDVEVVRVATAGTGAVAAAGQVGAQECGAHPASPTGRPTAPAVRDPPGASASRRRARSAPRS